MVARRRIPAATWRALPLKRHFRWVADVLEGLLRSDGYDILIAGGHDYAMRNSSTSCRSTSAIA